MRTFIETLQDALAGGWGKPIGSMEMFVAMLWASLIAFYIYTVYIFFTNKTFYSKDFNITLACVTLITTGLVAAIQSSLLVTLSVGGALSIIRFRTAIKSPIDLMFLFWSIACGIMCGTGVSAFAMMLSVFLTIVVIFLSKAPLIKSPYILIINADKNVDVDMINKVLKEECRYYSVKSSSLSTKHKDITIEIRTNDCDGIVNRISTINGVESVSILEHSGEVTF